MPSRAAAKRAGAQRRPAGRRPDSARSTSKARTARAAGAPPRKLAAEKPIGSPAVKLWIRLTLPGRGQIGPGKIELLRRIHECQSISAAAREMGMSYRRAWLLVDDLNATFRRPVVVKWMGGSSRGGATLTPTGEKLIASYDAVVARSAKASRALLDELAAITIG